MSGSETECVQQLGSTEWCGTVFLRQRNHLKTSREKFFTAFQKIFTASQLNQNSSNLVPFFGTWPASIGSSCQRLVCRVGGIGDLVSPNPSNGKPGFRSRASRWNKISAANFVTFFSFLWVVYVLGLAGVAIFDAQSPPPTARSRREYERNENLSSS